ncbi:VOC family protein [Tamlana sp. 2_MG-2023]|uniref:VOC family protein n=1 Tax=unclassified Tamlana TaxID=2614803 RepID=UPI0026E1E3F0|nr:MULTISPECIES: VOC family protein [unclassified Tamlana]MDO6761673.1 VOC family protein [Tamlana sp. 2_MG-2023]MDO6792227.1 VOC family protein [Tamlana sp. 1_MG-2023]
MKINPYLTFNGNCHEAMTFYKECLGGNLMLQPIEDSPMACKMPTEMKECILHATLTTQSFVLMGTDMTPETGLVKGNSISIMINCTSEVEIRDIFDKLSVNGKVYQLIEPTFWGTLLGSLIDKFGNNWILNYNKNNQLKNEKE